MKTFSFSETQQQEHPSSVISIQQQRHKYRSSARSTMMRGIGIGAQVLLVSVVVVVGMLCVIPSFEALSLDRSSRATSRSAFQRQEQQNGRHNNNNNNNNFAAVRPYNAPTSSSSSSAPVTSSSSVSSSASASTTLNSGVIMMMQPLNGESSSSSSSSPQSPSEFELGVGRALDTLRHDYPMLLVSHPDYSIYRKDISVIDPSGVHVHGLSSYKNAFRLLHAVVRLLYCSERSSLDFRMCYDTARHNIRIHWNAHVVPREIFGGIHSTLHVDGISVYELDNIGNITQHRIERLLINDAPIQPKEGLIAALQDRHQGITAVPSFCNLNDGNLVTEFRSLSPFQQRNPTSLLFAWEGMEESPGGTAAAASQPSSSSSSASSSSAAGASASFRSSSSSSTSSAASTATSSSAAASIAGTSATSSVGDSSSNTLLSIDYDKYEKKNKSRQKFGLKPLTVEEFVEIERQVQILDAQQRQRMEAAAAEAAAAKSREQEQHQPSFLEKLFGRVLPQNTCESNFDCERPEVCCDFGFQKRCCASGTPVGSSVPQYAYVPIPVGVNDGENGGDDDRMYPPRY